eukprot:CAMPEP_0118924400 /NCGR_PEP_ID=MMETSP1169-20130426/2554_1 /TAXON_ID=36882 /ORGANISM="Pyramimonas obovata, Strain CCMP722" /LENGTH=636 /DNA_ID=CAMNT_0006865509 /DNA_START=385 /DNA_END=2295 /DNA_ORIENTATION=-
MGCGASREPVENGKRLLELERENRRVVAQPRTIQAAVDTAEGSKTVEGAAVGDVQGGKASTVEDAVVGDVQDEKTAVGDAVVRDVSVEHAVVGNTDGVKVVGELADRKRTCESGVTPGFVLGASAENEQCLLEPEQESPQLVAELKASDAAVDIGDAGKTVGDAALGDVQAGKTALDADAVVGDVSIAETVVGDTDGVKVVDELADRKPTWELGVTLGFLWEFLTTLDNGHFRGDGDFTTDDLVEKFIKPAVKGKQCRYVDLIDERFVKPPTVFVSHRWKGGFRFLVERLFNQFNYATDESARDVSVWIDVFAVNQNQNAETKRDIDGFESVIQQTHTTAFNLDEKGEALRRVWCLYEVWKTFAHRGVDSLLVMSQGIDALALREVFYTVDVAKAEAFKPSDVEWILADIQKEFTFDVFNRNVRRALLESTTRQAQRVDTAGGGGEGSATKEQLASLNQHILMLSTAGRFTEALPVARRQLELAEKAPAGEGHDVNVAQALGNLAGVHQEMGEYDEALPLYERSLAIREKVHGADHPEVATGLNNLAVLYKRMGKYDEALPLYQRSLAIREKVYEADHPAVATSLNNMGGLYYNMGRYREARPLFERALAIRERVLGEEHPHTASTRDWLDDWPGW